MLIQFDTNQIAELANQTTAQQSQWDAIWNGVRSTLGATISEALDAYTGGSLDERSASYHAKTQQYTEAIQAQALATSRIGQIAAETNVAMAKTIAM